MILHIQEINWEILLTKIIWAIRFPPNAPKV